MGEWCAFEKQDHADKSTQYATKHQQTDCRQTTKKHNQSQVSLTLHGPGGGISQGTDSVALDGSGDLLQHRDLTQVSVTMLHLVQDRLHPASA